MGNGKQTSVLQLTPYNSFTGTGAVTVFYDSDCKGQASAFFADELVNVPRAYTSTELDWHNIAQFEIASVMVPLGYVARFYKGTDLTGDSVTVEGKQSDL